MFLAGIEYFGGARPLPFVQRPLQSASLLTAANVADGLGTERNYVGDLRRTGPLRQLQSGQCAQHNPNLLNAAAQ